MSVIRGSQITGTVPSASFALTASFVLNGNTNPGYLISTGSVSASVNLAGDIFIVKSGSYNPFTISNTGTATISGSANNLLLIKGNQNQSILTVSQSGVVVFATQSVELTGTAPNGGVYFTSGNFFVGLDS
ncbi:hypothetical protein UFOVP450_192 [uncultured Caudovirales phage]|uniref:Uncharacterized protein n=1 Tax=uncultured Caudovirales phage TaxID=2100421 RepID=A0A6J5MAF9_9CAUD|nr:hypothetical protein UFOVP450_192 [uncultured Caudovirales phage]